LTFGAQRSAFSFLELVFVSHRSLSLPNRPRSRTRIFLALVRRAVEFAGRRSLFTARRR
jgi:hypothetical protein